MININTKKIIPVVVVVVVIGLASLLLLNKNKETSPNNNGDSNSQNNQESVAEKFTGTLKDAIAMGVGMKCTYEVSGSQYEGYVKGKNYSGQIKTAEGQVGNVIVKDNCVWSWSSDGNNQGVKICYEPEEGETDGDVWNQEDMVDQDIVYNCNAAAISDSEFTPPTSVNFIDMDDMMKEYGM